MTQMQEMPKPLPGERARLDRIASREKKAAKKAANIENQALIVAEAARNKAERKAENAARSAMQANAALNALKQFIADNWPDRMRDARAVAEMAWANAISQPRSGSPDGHNAPAGTPHHQTQQEATG